MGAPESRALFAHLTQTIKLLQCLLQLDIDIRRIARLERQPTQFLRGMRQAHQDIGNGTFRYGRYLGAAVVAQYRLNRLWQPFYVRRKYLEIFRVRTKTIEAISYSSIRIFTLTLNALS